MSTATRTAPLPPSQTRGQRRPSHRGDIEGLRAVAVALVVAFHAGIGLVSGGYVGVDVFFVLSGFLITGLLLDEAARTGTISLTGFYARRARRLLPLAALVLAATTAAVFLLLPAMDWAKVARQLVASALSMANWQFAAESTQYMADTDQSPVLHYWSLSVEEQFYLVWPLLILLLVGRSGLAQRAWPVVARRVGVALGVIVAGSLWLSWVQTRDGSPFAYFGLHTRAWELGAGAALALLRPHLGALTRWAAHTFAAVGLLLIITAALVMDDRTPFPGTAALVPVLGTVLLVAAGARIPNGGVPRALSHPVPRYVGRVSYAWYLWHWPFLALTHYRWGESTGISVDSGPPRAAWPLVLAAVSASFVAAVLSHHLVEQPLRRASHLQASRRLTFALGGALVCLTLVAALPLSLAAPAQVAKASVVASADTAKPETPAALRKGCYNDFKTTTVPPAEDCRLGPAHGKLTVVLIGDSHSQHWMPAMERLAAERQWTVYAFAKSACTVVDANVWLSAEKHEYTSCAEWRHKMVARVQAMRGVDAVLIGRWMDYEGLVLRDDGSRVPVDEVGPVWQQAATKSFAAYAKAAPRIVVIRDTPRPTSHVPRCVERNEGKPGACEFDKRERTRRDTRLVEAERRAAPNAVRFVDLTDRICPTARCPVVEDGTLIYRDNHHLTVSYAALLAVPLGEAIEAVL
jgi:peptidoglycan/LPS O-acetylase OafA/YrhL